MKKISILSVTITALIFSATLAYAEIRVVSVKGTAAYKVGAQWVPLQAGTALTPGTKISTGIKSNAVIKINNHTLTVQPLSMIKITESMEDGKSSNTRIGLRRGSVRAKVAKDSRIKTVFKVSTPVATSSVRGTEEIIVYGPTFGMRIIVVEGTVEGSGLNNAFKLLSGNMEYKQGKDKGVPDNILSSIDDALGNKNVKFVTIDEETALNLFGEDFLYYEPSSGGGAQGRGVMIPVNIYLIWPQ